MATNIAGMAERPAFLEYARRTNTFTNRVLRKSVYPGNNRNRGHRNASQTSVVSVTDTQWARCSGPNWQPLCWQAALYEAVGTEWRLTLLILCWPEWARGYSWLINEFQVDSATQVTRPCSHINLKVQVHYPKLISANISLTLDVIVMPLRPGFHSHVCDNGVHHMKMNFKFKIWSACPLVPMRVFNIKIANSELKEHLFRKFTGNHNISYYYFSDFLLW
jgi:hypothetical protein